MKNSKTKNWFLICLFIGLPIISFAQNGFTAKEKKRTNVNTNVLNATKVDGSVNFSKSLQTNAPGASKAGNLNKFQKTGQPTGNLTLQKVVLSKETNLPVYIQVLPDTLNTPKLVSTDKSASCFNFLNQLAPVLKINNPNDQFLIKSTTADRFSNTHIRLNQLFKGIPIHGAEIIVHLDKNANGKSLNGHYFTIGNEPDTAPTLSSTQAIAIVSDDLKIDTEKSSLLFANTPLAKFVKPKAELTIYNKKDQANGFVLAYHVEMYAKNYHQWDYFIDATNGNILHKLQSTCYADGPKTANAQDLNGVSRSINTYQKGATYYLLDVTKDMFDNSSVIPDDPIGAIMTIDMDNTVGENQSFKYIVSANNTWNNPTAVSAHYNAGVAYEYYYTNHNRKSIDGIGGTIYSIINVADQETGGDLDNAFWSGKFMWYGNGDVSFKPLAGGLDVAGHEMTHGVIDNTANLEYDGESGAINESIADIFGAMMDNADWTIGEDVVQLSAFPSGALRSLSNPHNGGNSLSDRGYQPATMSEKYTGEEDNHGVHINSGISNHAFYLFAEAIGKADAADVYYKALTDYLTKSSQFIDLRLAVIQAATEIFGAGTNEVNQAGIAFDAVGITDGTGTNTNNSLPVNPGDEYILVYNTDSSSANTLYRTNADQSVLDPLTTTTFLSRPSITDDGSIAVFVAGDNTLHAIFTSPVDAPDEFIIQDQPIWTNAVISKDGNRLAAVTTDIDTTIWVYDFISETWAGFTLYNPSYTEGITAPGPLYADALEWDYTGEFLVYDCFNSLENTDGQNLEFWDVNFIHAWDNSAEDFGDGTIAKLFSSLPDNVSIGDPSFSKNSPNILAFDYIDSGLGEYSIVGCNIETNEVKKIIDNNTIGWPSYNKEDNQLAFTIINVDDNLQTNYTALQPDKISSDNSSTGIYGQTKWPVYYATGVRDFTTDIKEFKSVTAQNNLKCYPNPFTGLITLQLNENFNSNAKIEVINQLGQIVYSLDMKADSDRLVQLNLSNLGAGYYIIRASSNTEVSIGKVLKTD